MLCLNSVKTPRFGRAGDVSVEVSLNGQDFTANGLTYTVYAQPQFHTITPKYDIPVASYRQIER